MRVSQLPTIPGTVSLRVRYVSSSATSCFRWRFVQVLITSNHAFLRCSCTVPVEWRRGVALLLAGASALPFVSRSADPALVPARCSQRWMVPWRVAISSPSLCCEAALPYGGPEDGFPLFLSILCKSSCLIPAGNDSKCLTVPFEKNRLLRGQYSGSSVVWDLRWAGLGSPFASLVIRDPHPATSAGVPWGGADDFALVAVLLLSA